MNTTNCMNQIGNFVLNIFYEIAVWILAFLFLPKLLYQYIVKKKYRHSLPAKVGLGFNVKRDENLPLIWIHAVSMGETKAIVSLAREIKRLNPDTQLVISSLTETGHAEAKKSIPFANYHVYLPFDLKIITSHIISKSKPDLVILCESDFWFNFLNQAKAKGAAIALVNGKLSHKSMSNFEKASFFSKKLFNLFDVLCLQNELYQERFIKANAPSDRIAITGNLKLDDEYPRLSDIELNEWRERLGIKSDHLVLTIGSTHNPEEEIFLNILKKIWKKYPHLKVLIVPRHPERFNEVASLFAKEQIPYIRYSEIDKKSGDEKVVLIDAMGMLRMCYQLSDMALVAGSFTSKVGGHNILEPCWYGKPVLFGPHMHTQVELVGMMKQYEAGFQVNESELEGYLESWIANPTLREEVGARGYRLIADSKGSTQKTLNAMKPILDGIWKRFSIKK